MQSPSEAQSRVWWWPLLVLVVAASVLAAGMASTVSAPAESSVCEALEAGRFDVSRIDAAVVATLTETCAG